MKYNTPPDLIAMIQDMQKRLDQLERNTRPTAQAMAFGINADEWADTGAFPFSTTSATFTNAFYFPFVYTGPTPVAVFEAVCSDGTTSGEYRLADSATTSLTGVDGATIPPLVIPLGTTGATIFSTDQNPNYWDDMPLGTRRFIRLQVRRTAGAGTITVRSNYLYQKAS